MTKKPTIVSSHSLYKDSHIEVRQDVLKRKSFLWNQVYLHWNSKNAVCVIPFEKNGVYLINQYRHASAKTFWQFPGGLMEPKMSEFDLAKKELAEEAGFLADNVVKIGTVSPEPGLTTVRVKVFLATRLKKTKRSLEKSEIGMKLHFFDLMTVEKMIEQGNIDCGITLSAFLLFTLHQKKKVKKS